MKDTGISDPSSPPLSQTFISNFTLSGSLKYHPPWAHEPIPTLSTWGTVLLGTLLVAATLLHLRRKRP